MAEWVNAKVIKIKHWTDSLFSLIVHAPIEPFSAGQFTRLGVKINGEKIRRAYSYVNAPNDKNLEFYIVTIPKGTLSVFFHRLQPGDNIMIHKYASGFFVLDVIPKCETLWMLATGTAIGPYLSILEYGKNLDIFQNIVLIHAVRFAKDLSYLPKMLELKKRYQGKLRVHTVTSREKKENFLNGRLPALITDGTLEKTVNLDLNSDTSHVMLCGNPYMVHDTYHILKKDRGMSKNLKNTPGQVTIENYW